VSSSGSWTGLAGRSLGGVRSGGLRGLRLRAERRGYIKPGPFVLEVVLYYPESVRELCHPSSWCARLGRDGCAHLNYAHRDKLRDVGREGEAGGDEPAGGGGSPSSRMSRGAEGGAAGGRQRGFNTVGVRNQAGRHGRGHGQTISGPCTPSRLGLYRRGCQRATSHQVAEPTCYLARR